jgi:hypothetical protein
MVISKDSIPPFLEVALGNARALLWRINVSSTILVNLLDFLRTLKF